MKSPAAKARVQPRFRVWLEDDIAFGPGKAELLEQVVKCGSIAQAAAGLDMSYMRAWKLLKTMERCFAQPLVTVSRGGAKHGGATLTPQGKMVLKLYRRLETDSLHATAATQRQLLKLLKA